MHFHIIYSAMEDENKIDYKMSIIDKDTGRSRKMLGSYV